MYCCYSCHIHFHKPWFLKKTKTNFSSGFVAPYDKEHWYTLRGQKFVWHF